MNGRYAEQAEIRNELPDSNIGHIVYRPPGAVIFSSINVLCRTHEKFQFCAEAERSGA